MNGLGQSWMAQLTPQAAQLLAPVETDGELTVEITLMAALPKGNGFEEIVRCGTELGVTTFMPVVSDRTLLHPSANKLKRWQRIAQEAAEQCERDRVPALLEPAPFMQALQNLEADRRYLCIAREDAPHLLTCPCASASIAIATGPEGGWTPAEIEAALAAQFQAVSLGRRILRAITAPIAALSIVTALLEAER